MIDWFRLLSAFGVGAVISAVIQWWLTNKAAERKLSFQEKKEAYIGLLEALHRAAVEGTNEAAKEFAYWQMRCKLVGSPRVIRSIEEVIASNDDRSKRNVALSELESAMRDDIGVDDSPIA